MLANGRKTLALFTLLSCLILLAGCGSSGGGGGGSGGGQGGDVDTDGDGLSDSVEINQSHTSPLIADTDGDGLSDADEFLGGGFNPLVAEVPQLLVEFVGDVDVSLTEALSNNCSASAVVTNATLEAQSSGYSRTDARSTRQAIEASASVTTTAKASAFPPSASAEVSATLSASYSNVQESSTSFTSSSSQTAQQTYESSNSRTCFDGTETTGGKVSMGFKITNPSTLAFDLNSINLTVLQRDRQDPTKFKTLATVEPLNSTTVLAPGTDTGTLAVTADVPARRAIDLFKNPSGLFFEVGTYDILDAEGRNYAFINQTTLSRTALVVMDFGGNKPAERYLVATNVDRNPDGTLAGVKMRRVMEILGKSYTTEPGDNMGTPTGNVLASLDGISYNAGNFQFWYVFGTPADLNDPDVNFEDIKLMPRDVINMVLVRDQDGDGLFDREEFLLHTDPNNTDTDGDGINDYDEAKVGWLVSVLGDSYQVHSDPAQADIDGDGLNDQGERDHVNGATDPYIADTDGDGQNDDVDTDGNNGAPAITFTDLTLRRQGPDVVLAGILGALTNISNVNIDWGDGSAAVNIDPPGSTYSLFQQHNFASSGAYTVTVTVTDSAGPNNVAARAFDVNWSAPFTYDNYHYGQGWQDVYHLRTLADVNGDGKDDIVGFGGTTTVAISTGTGFGAISIWNDNFGTAQGWAVGTHPRHVLDMNNDGCADVLGFSSGNTLVALSNCSDKFDTATQWSADFGVADGYDVAVHDRFLVDINHDDLPDIVAFKDKTYVALNTGSGFASTVEGHADFGTNGGWSAATQPRFVLDVDGDGNVDILGFFNDGPHVALGDGTTSFGAISAALVDNFGYTAGGWRVESHPRYLADVNGDGLPDIVGMGSAGVYVSWNTSTPGNPSFSPIQFMIEQFGYNQSWRINFTVPQFYGGLPGYDFYQFNSNPRYLMDMNGDGRADIVGFGGAAVLVSLSKPDNTFAPVVTWSNSFGGNIWQEPVQQVNVNCVLNSCRTDRYFRFSPRMLDDVNGDGVPDIVGFGPAAQQTRVEPGVSIVGPYTP